MGSEYGWREVDGRESEGNGRKKDRREEKNIGRNGKRGGLKWKQI